MSDFFYVNCLLQSWSYKIMFVFIGQSVQDYSQVIQIIHKCPNIVRFTTIYSLNRDLREILVPRYGVCRHTSSLYNTGCADTHLHHTISPAQTYDFFFTTRAAQTSIFFIQLGLRRHASSLNKTSYTGKRVPIPVFLNRGYVDP